MKYERPELEWIRFEDRDILTTSNTTPIIPAEVTEEPETFDEPSEPVGE